MGWGHEEQKGPEGWAAGTESSCQVRRAAPSSTWRRSGDSRRLWQPLSSRDYCFGFDSSGVHVRKPSSPAQRAHQAAAEEPARPRLATGAKGGTGLKSLRRRTAHAPRKSRTTDAPSPGADVNSAQARGHCPAFGHPKILCRGGLDSAVRTRAPRRALPPSPRDSGSNRFCSRDSSRCSSPFPNTLPGSFAHAYIK